LLQCNKGVTEGNTEKSIEDKIIPNQTKIETKNLKEKFDSLSNKDKNNLEKILNSVRNKLITVSRAISKVGPLPTYLFQELYPLAENVGVPKVITALNLIKSEERNDPIENLTGLIVSKIRIIEGGGS